MSRPGTLLRDQTGAIMLIGVLMAVFMTALLYYVAGIGDALVQRERMQDAADAAAFSAAVIHARGMNAIALLNIVMAALLAVLVALKLVETLITVALGVIALASLFDAPLAEEIPDLVLARTKVRDAEAMLKPEIDTALEALHAAAVGLRTAVPVASMLPVIARVRADYGPPVELPLVIPIRPTLPTEDGQFSDLCDHATNYVAGLTKLAFEQVIPAPIAGLVGDAMRGLASAGADWFCGDGSQKPPKTTVKQPVKYPTLASRQACIDYGVDGAGYQADKHEALCKQAEDDETASKPDPVTGACVRDCGRGQPYDERDLRAREQCAPRKHNDHLRGFQWQERRFSRSYVFRHGDWFVKSDPRAEEAAATYTLHQTSDTRPCGGPFAPFGTAWNRQPHPTGADEVMPLCSNLGPPPRRGSEGEVVTLDHVEVKRLFGCSEEIERTYDVGQNDPGHVGPSPAGTVEQKVPQEIAKGTRLGEEDFQLRAIVAGSLPANTAEGAMRIATWHHEPGASPWDAAQGLGHLAVAQAEYFLDVEDPEQDSDTFLWSMRWKARLRRFRMPSGASGFEQQCTHVQADARAQAGAGGSGNTQEEAPCDAFHAFALELLSH